MVIVKTLGFPKIISLPTKFGYHDYHSIATTHNYDFKEFLCIYIYFLNKIVLNYFRIKHKCHCGGN